MNNDGQIVAPSHQSTWAMRQVRLLNAHILNLENEISELKKSSSWQITRPFRRISDLMRGIFPATRAIPDHTNPNIYTEAKLAGLGEEIKEVYSTSITERIESEALIAMARKDWISARSLWSSLSSIGSIENQGDEPSNFVNSGELITNWLVNPEKLKLETMNVRNVEVSEPSPQTVVYSATSNGYDVTWPVYPSVGQRYIHFTDSLDSEEWGIWENSPLPFIGSSSSMSSRWVKTHPHFLFEEQRWAVWTDSNILLVNGWEELLGEFQESGLAMGAIPHPRSKTIEEEIESCIEFGKDTSENLLQELARLGPDPGVGLWETGVCFFDLQHPKLPDLLNKWWFLIEAGSHRDQIYLPFAAQNTQVELHPILQNGKNVRTDSRFGYVPHKSVEFERAHCDLRSTWRRTEPQE